MSSGKLEEFKAYRLALDLFDQANEMSDLSAVALAKAEVLLAICHLPLATWGRIVDLLQVVDKMQISPLDGMEFLTELETLIKEAYYACSNDINISAN